MDCGVEVPKPSKNRFFCPPNPPKPPKLPPPETVTFLASEPPETGFQASRPRFLAPESSFRGSQTPRNCLQTTIPKKLAFLPYKYTNSAYGPGIPQILGNRRQDPRFGGPRPPNLGVFLRDTPNPYTATIINWTNGQS